MKNSINFSKLHDLGHMYDPKLPRGRDTHRVYGFNYRMTELQAAIVSVQLDKIDYIVSNKKIIIYWKTN